MDDAESTGVSRAPRIGQGLLVAAAALVLLGGLGLRVPFLDGVPSGGTDEGVWQTLALELHFGHDAAHQSDASFVTLLAARLVSFGFALFGPATWSGRAIWVAITGIGALTVVVISFRKACPALGIFAAALYLFHPWAIAWSRTVSVPYAVCLAIGVALPALFIYAAESHRFWTKTLAYTVCCQLGAIALQMSPLAVLPPAACGIWLLLSRYRRDLVRGPFAIAILLGVLHAVPVVLNILSATDRVGSPDNEFHWWRAEKYLFGVV
ncbi:MAG: hypothetical protein AAGF12_42030, partial [Myxococcota bacterium]